MGPDKEEIYTITEYKTNKKIVSKSGYSEHIRYKLEYAAEKVWDMDVKIIKAQKERDRLHDNLMDLSNELGRLISQDEHIKSIEYARWRYDELYPKKAKILKENK